MLAWVTNLSTSHNLYIEFSQGQLQEWTEHSPTDFRKFETNRDNQKIISTSFEHLKKCVMYVLDLVQSTSTDP